MRGSLPRLVARVIPKSQLSGQNVKVYPAPSASTEPKVTTFDLLLQQQAKAGADYPTNIRLEPPPVKSTLARVPADVRTELKDYLKER